MKQIVNQAKSIINVHNLMVGDARSIKQLFLSLTAPISWISASNAS